MASNYAIELWCGRGDLNPHAFRRHPLKMVCLPIPPLPLLNSIGRRPSEGTSRSAGHKSGPFISILYFRSLGLEFESRARFPLLIVYTRSNWGVQVSPSPARCDGN